MALLPTPAIAVALGAAAGGLARHVLSTGAPASHWRVLAINAAGSALLARVRILSLGPRIALLVGTGFCGGFTTFSTFAVDAASLARSHGRAYAAAYVLATNAIALLAVYAVQRGGGAGLKNR